MIENLHFIKDLAKQSQRALEEGDLIEFGRLMDVHWQRKKERSSNMSNQAITRGTIARCAMVRWAEN